MKSRLLLLGCLLLLLAGSACSSGGGGGGGGDASAGERSTGTGLRIIHAALDGTPVIVRFAEELIQQARYNEATFYSRVDSGDVILTVERANAPGSIISQLSTSLLDDTEYTVFVVSQTARGSVGAVVLEEPVVRPEEGFARVQVLNGYQGASSVSVASTTASVGSVSYASSSGYIDVVAGVHRLSFVRTDGQSLGSLTINIPDRGEATVLVSGSAELDVKFLQVFEDLD